MDTYYWSNSLNALHWIRKEGNQVVNKVKEIRDLTDSDRFNPLELTIELNNLDQRTGFHRIADDSSSNVSPDIILILHNPDMDDSYKKEEYEF
ncbi:hypothetical protein NPIL_94981 [Nephila pilipes]|uniref:Uncharacterized protein n=1 Tax=Nephila pilipes TaxID=299642 RepID=A0A8X6KNV5_NEPPI|nr:hypothetical protein NPIL_94981 [Nephila pilipes]